MEIRKFNRHESMDGKTRESILNTIRDLMMVDCETWNIQNMLYGFFDGYDYSPILPEHKEMKELMEADYDLYLKVMGYCNIVSQYPDGHTQV
jgi:hypothetical protein